MTTGPAAGQLYLGWQYATPHPDPGPPPRRPVPPDGAPVSTDWLTAQRREENLINRPVKLAAGVAVVAAACLAAGLAAGLLSAVTGIPALVVCLGVAAAGGYPMWRSERALRSRIIAEQRRTAVLRADAEQRTAARQQEHAEQAWRWHRQRSAFESQKRWYAVPLPAGIDRVDVAGGTLAGWSAMLTMAAAHLLAAGGEVTVIDLSGGAVGADLLSLAAVTGLGSGLSGESAVWVLPDDLPKLDLSAALGRAELAEVLALSAGAAEERTGNQLALDTAIIDRVIEVLYPVDGTGISLARVTAGVRALAQVGDVRADIAAGLLTEREAVAVSTLYGAGASDRVILERAVTVDAHLRLLAATGSEPPRLPRGRLRVVGLDGRAGPLPARVLGSFVIGALTCLIGQAGRANVGHPWRHTIFLLGADRLRDDLLDRLTDACETARCGLVLGYRTIPPQVRQRLGRGNAAVAVMRLGNAEEAKAASEQIGTEHRFVLSQLTETVGTSVTDTAGGSYTSTVGDSVSAAVSTSDSESTSRGGGRSHSGADGPLPFGAGQTSRSAEASTSRSTSESASLTAGISTSTAWGTSTSRAVGDNESLARSLQRSREFLVEAAELQRLPATAMILSYAGPSGRQVLLADANPAIGGLPVATMTPLTDAVIGLRPEPDLVPTWTPNVMPTAARPDRLTRPDSGES
jgi:hypothetical protein